MRQFYGQIRWYEKINGVQRPSSRHFYLFVTIIAFVLFHVRPHLSLKSAIIDLLHWPSAAAAQVLTGVLVLGCLI